MHALIALAHSNAWQLGICPHAILIPAHRRQGALMQEEAIGHDLVLVELRNKPQMGLSSDLLPLHILWRHIGVIDVLP